VRIRPMPAWASGRRRRTRGGRGLPHWASLLVALLLLAGIAWLAAPLMPPLPGPLTGRVRIVDGDTLRLGEVRVRLDGIDAPEHGQTCADAAGARWPCGAAATERLVRLVGGRPVTCVPSGHDRYGRIVATCRAGERDLAAAQVEGGLAVAERRYLAQELAARTSRSGIWAGRFERPADWRRAHPDGSEAPAWPSPLQMLLDWLGSGLFR